MCVHNNRPCLCRGSKFKRMIWMALKKGSFRAIVNEGDGETRGIVKVNTEPFCLTPPIHPHFYDQFVKDHIPKAPNGADGGLRVPKWQRLWETPPEQAMLPRRNRLGQIIPKKDEHGRPVLTADGKIVPVMEMQSDCRGLATYMEKIEGIKSKLKSALMYPIAVLVVAFVVVSVIMIFVIPAFKEVFTSFGADLPAPTRFVISMSEIFAKYWWIIFGTLVGGVYFWIQAFRRSERLRQIVSNGIHTGSLLPRRRIHACSRLIANSIRNDADSITTAIAVAPV